MRVRVNGSWEDIESGVVRVGNAWRRLASIRVYQGGAWREGKTFVPPLTASASPATLFGTRIGAGNVTTGTTTVTPSGGQGPYTYAWTRIGGIGTVNSPTSAVTSFSATLSTGDDTFGDFRCTVTDSLGSTAIANVGAFFTSNDPGGF